MSSPPITVVLPSSTFAIVMETMKSLNLAYPELDSAGRVNLATIRSELMVAGE